MWTVGLGRLAFGFHNPNHAAVASGAPCALWGEDDTRRVLPRARIDPEYANQLYTLAMAALWRGD